MREFNTIAAWPEAVTARNMASFCLRLVRGQRPLAPFTRGGRVAFVTDDPNLFAAILETRSHIYERPPHPYKEIAPFYEATGKLLLGLNRKDGHGHEHWQSVDSIVERETPVIANELAWRCQRVGTLGLLASLQELVLRLMTKLLFNVDSSEWSEQFVKAASFIESWQTLVKVAADHPALLHYCMASELEHRAAETVLRGSPALADRSMLKLHPRMTIIETMMNAYNGLATALTWVLYEISRRPEIHLTMRAEIDAADSSSASRRQDAPGLQFTRQVINECLRLYPVAWSLGRQATVDDQLDGSNIPKGAIVVCCTYAMHRNPAIWDKPDEFDATRFAPGRQAKRHRLAFLPYGTGEHACPARSIAPLIMQRLLMLLVKHYDIVLDEAKAVTPKSIISLQPSHELRLRLLRRNL